MFITFEGIEGSGKSTQIRKLASFFNSKDKQTTLTREPGGTPFGEEIRKLMLGTENIELNAQTELLLNFASRIEHIEKLIKPSLEAGKIVLSDRFVDSTFAYQGYGFGVDQKTIEQIKSLSIGNFEPNITFLIDLPVDEAFKRIENRKDNNRYEKLPIDFHQKIRKGFLELALTNKRIKIIDGTRSQDQVFKDIVQHINNLI
jgi:dTMP kinase